MAEVSEHFVKLPLDLIRNSPGFTLDIGASVAKIIYRSKEDYRNGLPINNGAQGKDKLSWMTLKKLPCNDVDGIIDLIKKDCDVTRGADVPEVIITGNGGNRHKRRLEDELNVRIKIVSEFETAVDGTILILKTSENAFVPLAELPQQEATDTYMQHRQFVKGNIAGQTRQTWVMMQDLEETLSWEPDTTKTFPLLEVTCGSGFGFDKIYEDGTFERVDTSLFGGRSLLGILAQLTKEKDFDEVLSMAAASDGRTVDLCGSDLVDAETRDEVYKSLDNDFVLFPFGKAYENEEAKAGDMAHSILKIFAMNISQVAHLVAICNDCPLVVFAGNLVSSAFVQGRITCDMKYRNLCSPPHKRVRYGFLQHGGFLTAIGALSAGARYDIYKK